MEREPRSGGGSPVDDAVLARAKAGDPSAQGQLYREHYARVRGHAQSLLGPDPDLDDVVQDVFVSAFRSLRGFRGESTLATWLHCVTVRVVRRHWRRRALRRLFHDGRRDEALADAAAPPPDDELREKARALFAALDRLGARLREAFVLRFVEGLSVEEAARVAGVRPDALKQRAGRAVHQLTELLQAPDGDGEGARDARG